MPEHHPIEISPPDISAYRAGNTGVDYVSVLDSGKPGPTAMIQALTHGNEFCGAIALDALLREGLAPRIGKLTLAFANVAAYARFDFDDPDRSRYIDEDYNRVWAHATLAGPRDSMELRRARELRPFVDAADFLLDIHSMHEPCRPIMVCGTIDKNAQYALRIGMPADLLLDTGHPAGLRMIERGGFGDPASPRCAVLIECGQHWEKSSVDVALDTTLRFLRATGMLDDAEVRSRLRLEPPAEQKILRVTEPVVAKSMDFRFAHPWGGLEVIPKAGTPVAYDRDATGEVVWRTPFDECVMVMPSMVHLKPGTTMVRLGRYVQSGT
jgi:predicted deacylase